MFVFKNTLSGGLFLYIYNTPVLPYCQCNRKKPSVGLFSGSIMESDRFGAIEDGTIEVSKLLPHLM